MKATNQSSKQIEIPARFRVSWATLWLDRLMTGGIMSGGVLIILAVLGIFLFILSETLPLFGGASLEEEKAKIANMPLHASLALDDKGTTMMAYFGGNEVDFADRASGAVLREQLPVPESAIPSAWMYSTEYAALVIGSSDGQVGTVKLHFDAKEGRGKLVGQAFYPLEESGDKSAAVEAIAYGKGNDQELFAVIQKSQEGRKSVKVLLLETPSSLISDDVEAEPVAWHDLTSLIPGNAEKVMVNNSGNGVFIYTDAAKLLYFELTSDEVKLVQLIEDPLGGGEAVTTLTWVFGDASFIVGGEKGGLKGFSYYWQDQADGSKLRLWGLTKEYAPFSSAVRAVSASHRNKSFIAATDSDIRLVFNTTAETRWAGQLNFTPVALTTNANFETLMLQDQKGALHFMKIEDPYPDASMKALFGKLWYEGYSAPAWEWQSTAANDDAEPKMSMMTLIFGTLKGTFYALIFAVPIALMAAIYTAHFMLPEVKRIVKPLMEIMASLPSVVLGFFGALWLAPKLEDKVPALLAVLILVPAIAWALGYAWSRATVEFRNKFRAGWEYLVLIPVILVVFYLSWTYVGDGLEEVIVWAATDVFGVAGAQITNFRELWQNGLGLPYEQRSSLVVGFVMGFAVIPVIFTIAEDALSNVPPSLVAGAQALGASRWQIVRSIVLPIASAGIFSALMIGLGRAVGETMIVLMATGNTPIMDWNIFNGMRTLAANIATELPEAVQHSGHYRILFFSGLILFMMTFVLNTLAEVLRHRLREKFKVV